jgi:hypothetical protein
LLRESRRPCPPPAEVEAAAVKIDWSFEEVAGVVVRDVSKPHQAQAAGADDNPGFDLLSHRAAADQRVMEVKGVSEPGVLN